MVPKTSSDEMSIEKYFLKCQILFETTLYLNENLVVTIEGYIMRYIFNFEFIMICLLFLLSLPQLACSEEFDSATNLNINSSWNYSNGESWGYEYGHDGNLMLTTKVEAPKFKCIWKSIDVPADGKIFFSWKIGDFISLSNFSFLIDDISQDSCNSTELFNKCFPINKGRHVIKWEIKLDYTEEGPWTRGWISDIKYIPNPQIPGSNISIVSGNLSTKQRKFKIIQKVSPEEIKMLKNKPTIIQENIELELDCTPMEISNIYIKLKSSDELVMNNNSTKGFLSVAKLINNVLECDPRVQNTTDTTGTLIIRFSLNDPNARIGSEYKLSIEDIRIKDLNGEELFHEGELPSKNIAITKIPQNGKV
jgi:hypothetical protein